MPVLCFLFNGRAQAGQGLSVTNLRCEYKVNPLGIDATHPRLSWEITSTKRAVTQAAYEIRYAATEAALTETDSAGKKTSSDSIHVVYDGPPLTSRKRVYWQVRVWDQAGTCSGWSDPAWFEMGLLHPSDWNADWIHPRIEEDLSKSQPSPLLRREFSVTGQVKSARVYVTSLGLYELTLNGKKVGDQVFTPGWTAYDELHQYQTYDITGMLKKGGNALGAMLGDGWYRGYLVWAGNRNIYGKKLALLLQLEITLQNGGKQVIATDTSWKASTGPILASDIYNGETYDARLEKENWCRASYNDANWKGVEVLNHSKEILTAPCGLPVRRIEEITPVKIFTTPAGDTVVDMGQNMVGRLRLRVKGKAGTKVTLRHTEVLDKEGNFYTENLRAAKQTVTYILKGGGVEAYEPHFTFQGFRYVDVDGYPGKLTKESLTGVVIHSDFRMTGDFSCSNSMLDQLQHNIQWGQKGNFLDVPTDCPQRDERLGWTGDAQVFAPTACFNADVAAFYTKWLKDLAADQQVTGAIPHVIPNVISRAGKGASAACGWADAGVIVPWTVYQAYGDTRILRNQYDSMQKWVAYMEKQAGDSSLWNTGQHFGDWLSFNTTRSDYPGATTDKDLLATAYFARSTDILRKTAALLGKKKDAAHYSEMLEKIKKAFQAEYVTPNGRLSSNTQTAYSVALAFGLIQPDLEKRAAERLAQRVRSFGHITTGFLGTPLICHVLSDYGYYNESFMLLNRKKYPSWLYPITKGATTIWERWDGIKPDGSFQDKGMNSFNHYAYGAIGSWLYEEVAGIQIDPEKPGYKHIIIDPHPGGGLTRAQAHIDSMYGTVASKWELKNKTRTLSVTIPPNTKATITLPGAHKDKARESGKALADAAGISSVKQTAEAVVLETGSGRYTFTWPVK